MKCLAVAPFAVPLRAVVDAGNREPQGDGTEQFYGLLNEARETFCAGEYARAYRLYDRLLARIPKRQSSSVMAEIEESRKKLRGILDDAADVLPRHEAAVMADPENTDTRFWYIVCLDRAGHEDEAVAECHTILKSPRSQRP